MIGWKQLKHQKIGAGEATGFFDSEEVCEVGQATDSRDLNNIDVD